MVGVRREDITWCCRSLEKYSKLISTASLKLNSDEKIVNNIILLLLIII